MKKNLLLLLAIMLASYALAQSKMDAISMMTLEDLRTGAASKAKVTMMTSNGNEDAVGAFITVDDESAYARLRQHGVCLGYANGNVTTAYIPLAAIDDVLAMNDVRRVQFARQMQMLTENTRAVCFVDDVHQGNGLERAYKGKGVIFGTVDCGIDFHHAAFNDEYGNSRIMMAYMPDTTKTAKGAKRNYPVSVGDYSTTLDKGYVYDHEGIAGITTGSKEDVHGTHTVGIAAGGSYGHERYYGMAPEADLILVDAPDLSDVNIANGVAFVFSEAQKAGKPAVVNLSIGSMKGSHSDNDPVNQLLNSLTGPGRIICTATGNSGDKATWLNKPANETVSTLLSPPFKLFGATVVVGDFTVWGKDDKEFKVRLLARDGTGKLTELYDSENAAEETKITNRTYLKYGSSINVTRSHIGGNHCVYVKCDNVEFRSTSDLVLEISGESEADAWSNSNELQFGTEEGTDFVAGVPDNSFNTLCCYDNAISIGSYNVASSFVWAGNGDNIGYGSQFPYGEVSYFSSYGVDRDGRQHPMVLAPGAIITSAVNNYCNYGKLLDTPNNGIVSYDKKDGRPQPYAINMGTSMSSPCVAGIVALWLEQNPTLTPQDVKNIIALTSVQDESTTGDNAKRSGYGKINALSGMQNVSTEIINKVKGNEPVIIASQRGFSVLSPKADAKVEVFNSAGQCVMSTTATGGATQSFGIGEGGMYIVKVGNTTKKIIL